MTGDVNDVMPGSDGLRTSGFEKKQQLVEFWTWTKQVDFWSGRGQTRGLRDARALVESVSWELTMYE